MHAESCLPPRARRRAALAALCLALAAAWLLPSPSAAAAPMPPTEPDAGLEPVVDARPIYVVRPGDTLTHIARRFGTRVDALVHANGLANPNYIRVGQQLVIPVLPPNLSTTVAREPRKGVAMAVRRLDDLRALDAAWYFTWGWCAAPGCVPMVYWMELPPHCPPVLLVGNEPNAVQPYGGPRTPQEAAARVLAIEAACPNTRLVVGNVAADDWSAAGGWGRGYDWLAAFLEAYAEAAGRPFHQVLGAHCYAQARGRYCVEQLAEMRGLYAGPMWVTEFGVLTGDPAQLRLMLAYIDEHFERYAVYTNRQPHTGEGWELASGVELVRGDGHLTEAGRAFADWPPFSAGRAGPGGG